MTDVAQPALESQDHDQVVARATGGMAPSGLDVFAGSNRLRPDGRPRADLRAELRKIPDLANAATVVSAVALPALVVALAIWLEHWLAVLAAIPLMGFAQNRMFILHHEGAHRLLFSRRRLNDLIGITVLGWLAFGTGTHHYRRAHANHHRDEFGPKEPDFLLYSFYPIAPASFRRKLRRDATGVSFWRIVKPRFTGIVKPEFLNLSLRFFAGQLVVLAMFALAGKPQYYLLLWVLPYATVYQVMNRLRSISEHGGMTRSDDRRRTSHHVKQSLLSKLMVPLGVGYHLAHHVDSGVPFRNLPRFHQVLVEDGYLPDDIVWPNYRSLWKALAAPSGAPSTAEA